MPAIGIAMGKDLALLRQRHPAAGGVSWLAASAISCVAPEHHQVCESWE